MSLPEKKQKCCKIYVSTQYYAKKYWGAQEWKNSPNWLKILSAYAKQASLWLFSSTSIQKFLFVIRSNCSMSCSSTCTVDSADDRDIALHLASLNCSVQRPLLFPKTALRTLAPTYFLKAVLEIVKRNQHPYQKLFCVQELKGSRKILLSSASIINYCIQCLNHMLSSQGQDMTDGGFARIFC